MRICDRTHGIDAKLTDRDVWPDPYPLYARLRHAAPMVRCKPAFVDGAWMATRYEEVTAMLKDADRFRSGAREITGKPSAFESRLAPKLMQAFGRSMVFADGLDHRRLRGLISKAFTPARIEQLRERVGQIVDELLDEASRGGTFDFIEGFAMPLPLRIISELLDVPDDEQHGFRRDIEATLDVRSAWSFVTHLPHYRRLHRFFERLLARKREQPGDDLTSALIAAEEDGSRLTPEELLGMLFLLQLAGHETTVNLLGNGTLALLEHPEQFQRVREDVSLVPTMVEEVLRYYSPVHFTGPRYVAEACELGGTPLVRGDRVVPLLAGANRDPEVFTDPDTFDVGRDPNRHVAFGFGRHFCIGAHLARVEANIAFPRIFDRWARLRLAVDRSEVRWRRDGSGLRGLQALPVAAG